MKKVDLEKKLRKAGCFLKREGASLWMNPRTSAKWCILMDQIIGIFEKRKTSFFEDCEKKQLMVLLFLYY